MSKPKILFRADGNDRIGLGHVYRSIALADILSPEFDFAVAIRDPSPGIFDIVKSAGGNVIALSPTDDSYKEAMTLTAVLQGFNIIVLDGYQFDTAYQEILKRKGGKLVCVDDIHSYHFVADAVINHAAGVTPDLYSAERYTRFFLGPRYALLREPFLSNVPAKDNAQQVDQVSLCFGGADPENMTEKYVAPILEAGCVSKLNVIVGGSYRHYEQLHRLCSPFQNVRVFQNLGAQDLFQCLSSPGIAIVSSSTILFEALACGTLTIAGYYINNQLDIYNGFSGAGLIQGVGDLHQVSGEEMVRVIHSVQSDAEGNRDKEKKMRQLFDGNIKKRFNQVFQELI